MNFKGTHLELKDFIYLLCGHSVLVRMNNSFFTPGFLVEAAFAIGSTFLGTYVQNIL